MPSQNLLNLEPRLSHNGILEPIQDGWRLMIPAGPAGRYRLSQLDDHMHIPRKKYPYRSPLTLSLRARTSSESAPGTWGFGLWNDPFGFSFGPGEGFFHLPALPNAIWFFFASQKNYLSFRDDKPAQGFIAQVFSSPAFQPSLFLAGLALPFSRKTTRRLLSRVIEEDSAAVRVEATQWHAYRLEWSPRRSRLWVDSALALDSPVSPRPPLGIVIWIDNQYAAFTPDGKLRWGLETNEKDAWLEIENIEIST